MPYYAATFECDTYRSFVYLYDSKICFKVLRCFGHVISKVHLAYYGFTDLFWMHFDEYVKKYCANYITELEFYIRNRSFENLQISFPNVETVRLLNCNLDKSITKFNERFPKMRGLELARGYSKGTKADDESCIVAYYPHLEHLSINISSWMSRAYVLGFRDETVLSVLELNPNIQSLQLCSDWGLEEEFVRSISKICKSLDILQITGCPLRFKGKIHFKSVKTFKIDHQCRFFNSPIPLTFDAVEAFEFDSVSPFKSFLFDFVRNNPTIVKLSLLFKSNSCIFTHDKMNEM